MQEGCMTKIQVFEPALCCNTGVCGQDADQTLVTFSADMDWVRSRGGDIRRYNLASEPMAFAENESVRAFLQVAGSEGLPLVLVEGATILTGSYPKRSQLATWAGLTLTATPSTSAVPANAQPLEVVDAADACCSPDPGNSQTCC
jgi:Arsenical resistance operon protein ArsD